MGEHAKRQARQLAFCFLLDLRSVLSGHDALLRIESSPSEQPRVVCGSWGVLSVAPGPRVGDMYRTQDTPSRYSGIFFFGLFPQKGVLGTVLGAGIKRVLNRGSHRK